MNSQLLVSPDKFSAVHLAAGEYWVRLTLRLTHEFTGGDLVRFSPAAMVSVEGVDKMSSSYTRANWVSAIVSGALYAFRVLRIPRQHLWVTELNGRLRACDMDAVANSSAIAIAKLVDKELPGLTNDGWDLQAQVMERQRSIAARENSQESADSASLPGLLSTERQHELRSMSTAELFLLVSVDKVERELSADEIRLIHDIAAERLGAGDTRAEGVLAAVNADAR